MADISQITVKIHLSIDIDGTPITEIIEAPASMEELDKSTGLNIHLSIDGRKLAKALAPHMASVVRNATGQRAM